MTNVQIGLDGGTPYLRWEIDARGDHWELTYIPEFDCNWWVCKWEWVGCDEKDFTPDLECVEALKFRTAEEALKKFAEVCGAK